MVEIERIVWTQKYEEDVKKIKDRSIILRLEKQIKKIVSNPDFGKPLRYGLKSEWTIYVRPYRLIYKVEKNALILLRFEHRDKVY
jgi:addiction module RelE/StbE family toxin